MLCVLRAASPWRNAKMHWPAAIDEFNSARLQDSGCCWVRSEKPTPMKFLRLGCKWSPKAQKTGDSPARHHGGRQPGENAAVSATWACSSALLAMDGQVTFPVWRALLEKRAGPCRQGTSARIYRHRRLIAGPHRRPRRTDLGKALNNLMNAIAAMVEA